MVELFWTYWFVTVPVLLGLFWLVSMWLVHEVVRRAFIRELRAQGVDPALWDQIEWSLSDRSRLAHVASVAFSLYHLPVLAPGLMRSTDGIGIRVWIVVPVQAAVYSALLWGVSLVV
jgi:hypothetical protein